MSASDRTDAPKPPSTPTAAGSAAAAAAPSASRPAPESGTRRGWLARLNPLNLFSHEEEQTPIAQARRLMSEQQYGQASLLFREILEKTPEDPEVLRGLSAINLRKGGRKHLKEALDLMAAAVRVSPYDPANYLMTTLVYSRMGRPTEAGMERKKMAVARTLQKNPDNATANNSMGVILLRANRHDAAIGCFQKAIAGNSGYEQAYRNLAKTYFVLARRETDGAKRNAWIASGQSAVHSALGIKTSAPSLITEARLLVLQGDTQAAEDRLNQAARLEPRHPELIEGWRLVSKESKGSKAPAAAS